MLLSTIFDWQDDTFRMGFFIVATIRFGALIAHDFLTIIVALAFVRVCSRPK